MAVNLCLFQKRDKEEGRELREGNALSPTHSWVSVWAAEAKHVREINVQPLQRRISIHAPLLRQEGEFLKD